jgi:hypothetical protein
MGIGRRELRPSPRRSHSGMAPSKGDNRMETPSAPTCIRPQCSKDFNELTTVRWARPVRSLNSPTQPCWTSSEVLGALITFLCPTCPVRSAANCAAFRMAIASKPARYTLKAAKEITPVFHAQSPLANWPTLTTQYPPCIIPTPIHSLKMCRVIIHPLAKRLPIG